MGLGLRLGLGSGEHLLVAKAEVRACEDAHAATRQRRFDGGGADGLARQREGDLGRSPAEIESSDVAELRGTDAVRLRIRPGFGSGSGLGLGRGLRLGLGLGFGLGSGWPS